MAFERVFGQGFVSSGGISKTPIYFSLVLCFVVCEMCLMCACVIYLLLQRKPKNRWRNKSETTQEGQKVLNVGCGIGGGDFYMSQNFDVSCRWLCHWTSTARLSLRLRIAPQKKKNLSR